MKKKLFAPTEDTASFGEKISQQLDNIESKMPKMIDNSDPETAKEIKEQMAAKITGRDEKAFGDEIEKRMAKKKLGSGESRGTTEKMVQHYASEAGAKSVKPGNQQVVCEFKTQDDCDEFASAMNNAGYRVQKSGKMAGVYYKS